MNLDILKKAGDAITRVGGRKLLVLKKYSPQIMLAGGLACIGGGTFMACRNTLRLEETLDNSKEAIDKAKRNGDKKEIVKTYIKSAGNIGELYGPPAALMAGGASLILGANHIQSSRIAAAFAACEALSVSFEDYRERMIEALGEDTERKIRLGLETVEVTEETVDEKTGKRKKVKKQYEITDELVQPSPYARYFDDSSLEWKDCSDYNLVFLKHQQQWANDKLIANGHLFLNEVYDALGIPRSRAGQLVGWVVDGNGDGFVDFGIHNIEYTPNRDFVNGLNNAVLLDFNVDGVIYDLI